MFKKTVLIFSLLLGSHSGFALTPQKYCEKLGASSCELLDIKVGGCTTNAIACSVIIKYCKNGDFRIHPTAQQLTNSQSYYVHYKTAGGANATFGFGAGAITTKTNAELCADLP